MEKVIETNVYLSLDIGGKSVPFITDAVVNTWVVMAMLIIAGLVMARKLKPVPEGGQKAVEAYIDIIRGLAKSQIGHNYKPYTAYIGTILLFIACSNLVAIFNIVPSFSNFAIWFNQPELSAIRYEVDPPTRNFNVTLCLALASMAIVIFSEFKYRGFKGWLKSFIYPTPISWFIKLLDYIVRPMSLCLRLFGNIVGGYIVMTLLYMSMPAVIPAVIGIYFDIFDGGLQAYVFVFLTMLYIAEAVEEVE